ncbi:MAG: hypothetical protein OEY33_03990 [Bdellovibrionales bacterium]|nr:hypothetical protein [Bdellovibrionales bacterium]
MILFIKIQSFISLIWRLLSPVIRLLPFLKRRLAFERKNINAKSHSPCHICFEISSEGELQQIKPILLSFLEASKRVELIFSSSSVESKVEKLASMYPAQMELLRYPFLTGPKIQKWITAKTLVLCRYDFFPDLILYGARKDVKFILLSAAIKHKRVRPHTIRGIYWKTLFSLFDLIITTNDEELNAFQELGVNSKVIESFEFRKLQILRRLDKAKETLSQLALGPKLFSWYGQYKYSKRLILGSAWISDLDIFKSPEIRSLVKKGELGILIAPHKLDSSFVSNIKAWFNQNDYQTEVINNHATNFGEINICTIPGILVELYSYFGLCYVGGGFERSIHSVLEPFLAGGHVFCGPRTHRSTEYQHILSVSPDRLTRLQHNLDTSGFFNCFIPEKKQSWVEDLKTEEKRGAILMNQIEELTYGMQRRALQ